MARAEPLGLYHRPLEVSRRGAIEARAERGERAAAMAARVLLVGAELGERAAGHRVEEDGIVAEATAAARREGDRALAPTLDLDDLIVRRRERERAAER